MASALTFFEETTEDVHGVPMCVYKNRFRSLRQLLLASAANGEKEYVVDGDRRLTFESHVATALSLGAVLRQEYGVQPGERVGILGSNSAEWVLAFWAAVSIGAIVAPMNTYWSSEEFDGAVRLTEPVLLLGDQKALDRRLPAGSDLRRISWDDEGFWPLAESRLGEGPVSVESDEDDPAVLVFTSGTTGLPKAVVHSHRSVCGFVHLNMHNGMLRMTASSAPPVGQSRMLATAPLFHVAALHGAAIQHLAVGGCIVLIKGRFDPHKTLATIEAERVTVWPALGSAGPRVAEHPELDAFDLSSLQTVSVGGAPCSPATQDLLRAAFPKAALGLSMGYTSSEACAVIASTGGDDYAEHPTATGKVFHGIEIEIRDDDGNVLPDGVDGNIHVRSPYVMLGYWRNEAATNAVLAPDRWLSMGDVGHLVDGRLFVNSRLRDLIFVSAENVFPSEVEYRLDAHPGVSESAVVGEDDPITGQAVVAHIVASGPDPTIDELRQWCAASLAKYKVPTKWVIRTEPLPRNPTGKILKRELHSS